MLNKEKKVLSVIKNGMNVYNISRAANLHWVTAKKRLSKLESEGQIIRMDIGNHQVYFPIVVEKEICNISNGKYKLERIINKLDNKSIRIVSENTSIILSEQDFEFIIHKYLKKDNTPILGSPKEKKPF